ncbi:MAG: DUF4258 domain-containing protein [Candidatus Nitrospinota bacterium M3_3B_026]
MSNKLVFRAHAVWRMSQRGISGQDVREALEKGETIESYPDDSPYPSRLVLGWIGHRPVHVAVADNMEEDEIIVITAYEPDAERWEEGFSRRKKS